MRGMREMGGDEGDEGGREADDVDAFVEEKRR